MLVGAAAGCRGSGRPGSTPLAAGSALVSPKGPSSANQMLIQDLWFKFAENGRFRTNGHEFTPECARIARLFEADRRIPGQLLQLVTGIDATHRPRLGPHHQRLGRSAPRVVMDTPQ